MIVFKNVDASIFEKFLSNGIIKAMSRPKDLKISNFLSICISIGNLSFVCNTCLGCGSNVIITDLPSIELA